MNNYQKGASGIELLIYLVFFVAFFVLNMFWNVYSCNNYGSLTDRVTKYSIANGCYVKTPSGWIPEEEMSKRAYGNSITETIPLPGEE